MNGENNNTLKDLEEMLSGLHQQAERISKDIDGVKIAIKLYRRGGQEAFPFYKETIGERGNGFPTPTESVRNILKENPKTWWLFGDILSEVQRRGVNSNSRNMKTNIFSVISRLYKITKEVDRRGKTGDICID